MRKNDRIREAKVVALAIANKKPSHEWLHIDKALTAEGCKLTPTDEPRVFAFKDKDGSRLTFVCSKNRVVQYLASDYRMFKKLDARLAAAKTQKEVNAVSVDLDKGHLPASLRNTIEQGIEACISQIRNGVCALPVEVESHRVETPKTEPKKTERKKVERLPREKQHDEVCRLALELDGEVKFTQKREGACFWASGNVSAHKEALKRAGFVWSRKRQAYYWKPVVSIAA